LDIAKKSVLIVDDESSNVLALAHILSSGYAIYAAGNGEDAIKAAEKYMPDIILLDVIMPNMDGYDVIAALRASEKTRNIPVIFITGLSNSIDEEKGLISGGADYICKPFSPAIVKLRLRNQIKIREREMEAEAANKAKHALINEIRTPMGAILETAEAILKDAGVDSRVKEGLEKICASGGALLGIINDAGKERNPDEKP